MIIINSEMNRPFKRFVDDSINVYVHLARFWSAIAGVKVDCTAISA